MGIIARVPLASGLLAGRYTETTTFLADDHRTFNRKGTAFDVGETFSGVPYEIGAQAAREVATRVPSSVTTAQLALRWVLDHEGVSVVIPGARSAEQVRADAAAADLAPLGPAAHAAICSIYDDRIRPLVHHRW